MRKSKKQGTDLETRLNLSSQVWWSLKKLEVDKETDLCTEFWQRNQENNFIFQNVCFQQLRTVWALSQEADGMELTDQTSLKRNG
jgi:phosphopantetheine adenylyltransferase